MSPEEERQFRLVLYLLVQPSLHNFHALAHFSNGVLVRSMFSGTPWKAELPLFGQRQSTVSSGIQ